MVSSSRKIDRNPTKGEEKETLYKTDTDIIVIDDEDSDENKRIEEKRTEEENEKEILRVMKVIYDTENRPKQYAWVKEEMITLTYAKELKNNVITDTQIEVLKRIRKIFQTDKEDTDEEEKEGKIRVIGANEAQVSAKIAEDLIVFNAKIIECARIKILINTQTFEKITEVQMSRVNEQCFNYELIRAKEKIKMQSNEIVSNNKKKIVKNINKYFPRMTFKLKEVTNRITDRMKNNKEQTENDGSQRNRPKKRQSVESVSKDLRGTNIEQLKHIENKITDSVGKCQTSVNKIADDASMRSKQRGGAVVTQNVKKILRSERSNSEDIRDSIDSKDSEEIDRIVSENEKQLDKTGNIDRDGIDINTTRVSERDIENSTGERYEDRERLNME